jgi:hypothetical protein
MRSQLSQGAENLIILKELSRKYYLNIEKQKPIKIEIKICVQKDNKSTYFTII